MWIMSDRNPSGSLNNHGNMLVPDQLRSPRVANDRGRAWRPGKTAKNGDFPESALSGRMHVCLVT